MRQTKGEHNIAYIYLKISPHRLVVKCAHVLIVSLLGFVVFVYLVLHTYCLLCHF